MNMYSGAFQNIKDIDDNFLDDDPNKTRASTSKLATAETIITDGSKKVFETLMTDLEVNNDMQTLVKASTSKIEAVKEKAVGTKEELETVLKSFADRKERTGKRKGEFYRKIKTAFNGKPKELKDKYDEIFLQATMDKTEDESGGRRKKKRGNTNTIMNVLMQIINKQGDEAQRLAELTQQIEQRDQERTRSQSLVETCDREISRHLKLTQITNSVNTNKIQARDLSKGSNTDIALGKLVLKETALQQDSTNKTVRRIAPLDENKSSVSLTGTNYDISYTNVTTKNGSKPLMIRISGLTSPNRKLNSENIQVLDPNNRVAGEPQPLPPDEYPIQIDLNIKLKTQDNLNFDGREPNFHITSINTLPLTIHMPTLSEAAKKQTLRNRLQNGTPTLVQNIQSNILQHQHNRINPKTQESAMNFFEKFVEEKGLGNEYKLFFKQAFKHSSTSDLLAAIISLITEDDSLLLGSNPDDKSLHSIDNHFSKNGFPTFHGGTQETFGDAFESWIQDLQTNYATSTERNNFCGTESEEFWYAVARRLINRTDPIAIVRPGDNTITTTSFSMHLNAYRNYLENSYPEVLDYTSVFDTLSTGEASMYKDTFNRLDFSQPMAQDITLLTGETAVLQIALGKEGGNYKCGLKITNKSSGELLMPTDGDYHMGTSLSTIKDVYKFIHSTSTDLGTHAISPIEKKYAGHISSTFSSLVINHLTRAANPNNEPEISYNDTSLGTTTTGHIRLTINRAKSMYTELNVDGSYSYTQNLENKTSVIELNNAAQALNIALINMHTNLAEAKEGNKDIPTILRPKVFKGRELKMGENCRIMTDKHGKPHWIVEREDGKYIFDSSMKGDKWIKREEREKQQGRSSVRESGQRTLDKGKRAGQASRKLVETMGEILEETVDLFKTGTGTVFYLSKGKIRVADQARSSKNPSRFEDTNTLQEVLVPTIRTQEASDKQQAGEEEYKAHLKQPIRGFLEQRFTERYAPIIAKRANFFIKLSNKKNQKPEHMKKRARNYIDLRMVPKKIPTRKAYVDQVTEQFVEILSSNGEIDPQEKITRITKICEETVLKAKAVRLDAMTETLTTALYSKEGYADKQAIVQNFLRKTLTKHTYNQAGRQLQEFGDLNIRKQPRTLIRGAFLELPPALRHTAATTVQGLVTTAKAALKIGEILSSPFSKPRGRNQRLSHYQIRHIIEHAPPEFRQAHPELTTEEDIQSHILHIALKEEVNRARPGPERTGRIRKKTPHPLVNGAFFVKKKINGVDKIVCIHRESMENGESILGITLMDKTQLQTTLSSPPYDTESQEAFSAGQSETLSQRNHQTSLLTDNEHSAGRLSTNLLSERRKNYMMSKTSPIESTALLHPDGSIRGQKSTTGLNIQTQREKDHTLIASFIEILDNDGKLSR